MRRNPGVPPRVKGVTGKEINNLEIIAQRVLLMAVSRPRCSTVLSQGSLASGSSLSDTKKEAIHEDAALLSVALVCFHHCIPRVHGACCGENDAFSTSKIVRPLEFSVHSRCRKCHGQINENRSLAYQLERKGDGRDKNKVRALWLL
jgi:hypothetical protein